MLYSRTFTGAWIETDILASDTILAKSHLYRCVAKDRMNCVVGQRKALIAYATRKNACSDHSYQGAF